jgi:ribonuclease Z
MSGAAARSHQQPPPLDLCGIQVRAVSVGGLETCIELPGWNLCFDIGRCPPTAARLRTVAVTHAHVDHLGGIAHHCAMRDLWSLPAPQYIIPAEYADDFQELLAVWRRLDRSELPCTVVPVSPGDEVRLGPGRVLRAFRASHRIPTLGYALVQRRQKLLRELVGLPEAEVIARRRAGERVSEEVEEVAVAFCGDTTVDVLRHEEVRTARLLILECTFPSPEVPAAKARRCGHVHLDELLPRLSELANEKILLTHFSSRYDARRLQEILAERLPASERERIVPLLPGPPWKP